MKYSIVNNNLCATAENVQEGQLLLSLQQQTIRKVEKREVARKGHDNYKGKHRLPCSLCGKRFKGVKIHIRYVHPESYEKIYGAKPTSHYRTTPSYVPTFQTVGGQS